MSGRALVLGLGVVTSAGRAAADPRADALAAITAAVPACDPARAHCVALRVHVAPGDGTAGARPLVVDAAWIAAQVAQATALFAAIDVAFEVVGVEVLPAAAAHLPTRAARDALAAHVRARALDVFVTGQLDNVDDPAAPVRGVAWRAGRHKFVILGATAPDRVLAHELGHMFGLPHSTYAVSLMNKTPRAEPPLAARTFAPEELVVMTRALPRLARARVLVRRPR